MAIKLKVGNLVAAFQSQALNRLANASLPIKTASALKSVLTQAQEAANQHEKDRIELCKKYGKLNAETDNYEFLDDNGELDKERFEQFGKEADELLQKELTFIGNPFGISQFYNSHAITANDLMILEWLISIPVDAHASAAVN